MSKILCMWLREVCSCCSLTALPGPAWVLLSYVLQRILLISVDLFSCLPCAVFASVAERGGETHRPRPKTRSRPRPLTYSIDSRVSLDTTRRGASSIAAHLSRVNKMGMGGSGGAARNQGDPPRRAINKSMMQLPLRSICLCSAFMDGFFGFTAS